MKRTNKKGFTLVELVIVIAIIAILAAVLIPTFSGVVEKANESKALQTARNAYTEYVVSLGADVPESVNICIEVLKSGTTYYYIPVVNGQIDTNKPETTKPTGYVEDAVDGTFAGCHVYLASN